MLNQYTDLMKVYFLSVILLISFLGVSAQTANWQWARSASGGGATSICTDSDGDHYVLGEFSGPSVTFGAITLTNAGSGTRDICVVKYDTSGNVLWARSIGSAANDFPFHIINDVSGNVIVTGSFMGANLTIGSTTFNNAGGVDIFLVKYDPFGNILWASSAGGVDYDYGFGLASDSSGCIYLTGYFSSPTINFGSTTLINTLAAGGENDFFIAKYSAGGNPIWAKKEGGDDGKYGKSVSVDLQGNVLVIGAFFGDSMIFSSVSLVNNNSQKNDIFIAKYDSSGNILWARSIGGYNHDTPAAIASDKSGNVLVEGHFFSPFLYLGTTTLTNSQQGEDLFLAKYDSVGKLLWATSAGGDSTGVFAADIALDSIGNEYIIGNFIYSWVTFDTITLTNAGQQNFFIVKYDTSGKVLWATSMGGTGLDYGSAISVDTHAGISICGGFDSPALAFGAATLTNINSIGSFFVASMDAIGALGIMDFETQDQGVSISPNPFSAETVIRSRNILNSATLYVLNSQGELVKEVKNISGQSVVLSRANLRGGLYLILIEQEGGIAVAKVLIQD